MTDFDVNGSSTTEWNALLDGLAPKSRVHEVAKRFGVPSRLLIEALAEQGVALKSSSSSVDAAAARTALTTLVERGQLTPPAAEQPMLDIEAAPPAVAETETAPDAVQTAPEPVPAPAAEPAPWAPLFTEAPVAPARTEAPSRTVATAAAAAPVDVAAEDSRFDDLPARMRVHELAKRAGVSAKVMIAELTERGIAAKSANSVVAKAVAQDLLADLLGAVAPAAEETTTHTSTDTSAVSDEAAGDSEADRRGRRRRGRRGRGRPTDRPQDQDESDDDDTVADQDDTSAPDAVDQPSAAPATETADDGDADDTEDTDENDDDNEGANRSRTGRRRRRRGGRAPERTPSDAGTGPAAEGDQPGETADAESDEADDDAADGAEGPDGPDDSGSASSRRRRRRRRGGADDAGRTDDPADTVVHVREVRSAESEVQGVRGSTRLEAKRQRRRDSLQTRRRPQILTEAEFLARREAVHRVMAVRQRGDLTQVAVLEDNVLVEHFVSRAGSASMIGNVYLGRVQNVLPSMEAAFVDIGRGRNAVLYAGEVNWEAAGLAGKSRKIETALSSGDTVLVQVSKDPVGHKGSRLTTQISLPGRFLVYVPAGGATGISRKLPDTERKRLKGILDRIVPDDAGVIIRTAAEGVSEEELAADVERLKSQWEQISEQAKKLSGSGNTKQLYSEPDTLIKVIRDLFNSDISELIIDGDDDEQHGIWESLSGYVEQVAPELAPRVHKFTGATDVFAAHRIDEQIAKALERKVYLPSGGSLVIDRTEAMTVIDVNTGKYTGSGGNLEETVTKNNLEAAEEVVRQLRLRDIGGIIVVDFIDMVLESNRELVLRRLTECLGRDRTRHQVAEVTSLGLIQMTRKKMGTGLVEAFSEPCEHCHGRGIVLRDVPVDPGIVEAFEPQPDRSSNRRNRGRADGRSDGRSDGRADRSREPAVEVDLALPPALPAVPPLRRDPRGPKPPELGGPRVDEFGPRTDASGNELSSELLAELNGRALDDADVDDAEDASAETVDVASLESLLPHGGDSADGEPAENAGPRRRRRGGRGKSRRDPRDNGADTDLVDADLETDVPLTSDDAGPSDVVDSDSDATLDDPQVLDLENDEVESDDPELELALDTDDTGAVDADPVDSGGAEAVGETGSAETPPEPVVEVELFTAPPAPEPAPERPRRRRSASRPAGPPQGAGQSASLL